VPAFNAPSRAAALPAQRGYDQERSHYRESSDNQVYFQQGVQDGQHDRQFGGNRSEHPQPATRASSAPGETVMTSMDTHARTRASEEPKSSPEMDPGRKVLDQALKLLVVLDENRWFIAPLALYFVIKST
jgi:hypothetical protein